MTLPKYIDGLPIKYFMPTPREDVPEAPKHVHSEALISRTYHVNEWKPDWRTHPHD